MNRKRLLANTLLLVAALLLPVTPVLADDGDPGNDGIIIFGEDYTVESGETVEGELVVFGGDAIVEDGGTVEGSVVVWGGDAEIEGTVEGDVVVSGGDITLGPEAWVQGDIVCSWDCDLEQDEGARLDGSITEGAPLPRIPFDDWSSIPMPPSPQINYFEGPMTVFNMMLRGLSIVISVLLVAALGGLVALIWPEQVAQTGRAIVKSPGPSLGYGLLTVLAGGALTLVLVITICLSPLGFLAGLALFAAALLGWICVGALVGERLLKSFKASAVSPVWSTGLGTLVITAIVALIDTGLSLDILCCLQPLIWVMALIVGCIGLGAVILTRFGTQIYPPSTGIMPPEEIEPSES